jgi:pyrroloquinoline quinone biosynthesis protein B
MKYNLLLIAIFSVLIFTNCEKQIKKSEVTESQVFIKILGIAQDAGYPQVGCKKACCERVLDNPKLREKVVSLGLVDGSTGERWLFEATPDFREQYNDLISISPIADTLSGIFLTHAHIGHYTGLMQLGREVMGASNVPVFAMPKMRKFLYTNGPWRQLSALNNIKIQKINTDSTMLLNDDLRVKPLLVPHRDEFSETVGFIIQSKQKSILFIPDIDKWSKWNLDIVEIIKQVDYAVLDATFYANGEIPNRDMSEIPHPFVEESMNVFDGLSNADKSKVIFIHFNHTNPLLNEKTTAYKNVIQQGYQIAREGMILNL